MNNRCSVVYYSRNIAKVHTPGLNTEYSGFRFKGNYLGGSGDPCLIGTSLKIFLDRNQANLTIGDHWNAIFMTKLGPKVMPYIRLGADATSFRSMREGHNNTEDYHLPDITGRECLVITRGGEFAGEVCKIIENTSGTIKLDRHHGLKDGDMLLPAPCKGNDYVYLCSLYIDLDSAGRLDIRNIADGGSEVMSLMGNIKGPKESGIIDFSSRICPLATGVMVEEEQTILAPFPGSLEHKYDHDGSNHVVSACRYSKSSFWPEKVRFKHTVTFSKSQKMWFSSTGILTKFKYKPKIYIKGWIEL